MMNYVCLIQRSVCTLVRNACVTIRKHVIVQYCSITIFRSNFPRSIMVTSLEVTRYGIVCQYIGNPNPLLFHGIQAR